MMEALHRSLLMQEANEARVIEQANKLIHKYTENGQRSVWLTEYEGMAYEMIKMLIMARRDLAMHRDNFGSKKEDEHEFMRIEREEVRDLLVADGHNMPVSKRFVSWIWVKSWWENCLEDKGLEKFAALWPTPSRQPQGPSDIDVEYEARRRKEWNPDPPNAIRDSSHASVSVHQAVAAEETAVLRQQTSETPLEDTINASSQAFSGRDERKEARIRQNPALTFSEPMLVDAPENGDLEPMNEPRVLTRDERKQLWCSVMGGYENDFPRLEIRLSRTVDWAQLLMRFPSGECLTPEDSEMDPRVRIIYIADSKSLQLTLTPGTDHTDRAIQLLGVFTWLGVVEWVVRAAEGKPDVFYDFCHCLNQYCPMTHCPDRQIEYEIKQFGVDAAAETE